LDAASGVAADTTGHVGAKLRGSEASRVAELISRLRSSTARMGLGPRDLFSRLDLNMDGRISVAELERLTLQLQPDLSLSERQLFFQSIDLDGSGDIDIREFCAIFQATEGHCPSHHCSSVDDTRVFEGRNNDMRRLGVRA